MREVENTTEEPLDVSTTRNPGAEKLLGNPLADVLARRERLDGLAIDALLQLRQELGYLCVDVDTAVARHLVRPDGQAPGPARTVLGTELTVVDVADRLHRRVNYVRTLLRRKSLPGYRRGKYWVIPETELLAWQARGKGLDDPGGTTLPSSGRPRQSPTHQKVARPYTIRVRRCRSASNDGRELDATGTGYPDHG